MIKRVGWSSLIRMEIQDGQYMLLLVINIPDELSLDARIISS